MSVKPFSFSHLRSLASVKSATRKKSPRKIAVFDIHNNLVYYQWRKEKTHPYPNGTPIKPIVHKLHKKIQDPDTLVIVQTNGSEKHAREVMDNLGVQAKFIFHRLSPDNKFLDHGSLERISFTDHEPAVDCIIGVSDSLRNQRYSSNNKGLDDKVLSSSISYQKKPNTHQLRDVLFQLKQHGLLELHELEKLTIFDDKPHTGGILGKNMLDEIQAQIQKPLKLKFHCVAPYQKETNKDLIDTGKSYANYSTKKGYPQ
jgi:hypothetical protein